MPVDNRRLLPAIAIGAILGGPELYQGPTEAVIQYLTLAFDTLNARVLAENAAVLNLIVIVSGSLTSREQGLRFQTVVADERRAVFQLSLPASFIRPRARNVNFQADRDDQSWTKRFLAYLLSSLRSAVPLAKRHLKSQKIEVPEAEFLALIRAVAMNLDVPDWGETAKSGSLVEEKD